MTRNRIITAPASEETPVEFLHSLGFGMTPAERAASDERGRKFAARLKAKEAEDREYTARRVAELSHDRLEQALREHIQRDLSFTIEMQNRRDAA